MCYIRSSEFCYLKFKIRYFQTPSLFFMLDIILLPRFIQESKNVLVDTLLRKDVTLQYWRELTLSWANMAS